MAPPAVEAGVRSSVTCETKLPLCRHCWNLVLQWIFGGSDVGIVVSSKEALYSGIPT